MEKINITNRKGQKVVVVVERSVAAQKGLAFVMHGLGGNKEQAHVQTMKDAFVDAGYTAVMFDTTNTVGESDGSYEDATTTNYLADLEDVLVWASEQGWYEEPFVLAGHSLGGFCISLYAENYPEKVRALAPIGTTISGKLSLQVPRYADLIDQWKADGVIEIKTAKGSKRLKWSHMEDRLRYDVLSEVEKLAMPVLLVVGSEDGSALPEHQQTLYDAIGHDKKEIHIVDGAPHTFVEAEHLAALRKYFEEWITKI